MRAGSREDRIIIQQQTRVKDKIGGYTTTWSTYAIVWADVKPMDGAEAMKYGQTVQKYPYRVFINYDDAPLVDGSMRIKDNGDTITIQNVIEHKRKNKIEIIGTRSDD